MEVVVELVTVIAPEEPPFQLPTPPEEDIESVVELVMVIVPEEPPPSP
jgi:hypothetical protein